MQSYYVLLQKLPGTFLTLLLFMIILGAIAKIALDMILLLINY